jgi:hypothetical protein
LNLEVAPVARDRLHPNTCTYLYWIGIRATVTWNDSSQRVADVGTVVGGEHPLSDYDTVLSGGGDVAAHSSAFISAGDLSTDYFVSDKITIVAGENAGAPLRSPGPLRPDHELKGSFGSR